jgi:integrase
MGVADKHVHRRVRSGREVWVIDFYFTGPEGRRDRFKRAAEIQQAGAAKAEAEERYILAVQTGDPRLPRERLEAKAAEPELPKVPTLRAFYTGTYTEVFLPRLAPSTRDRYKALSNQGVLDLLGDTPVNEIDRLADLKFDAWLGRKKINAYGPRGFLHAMVRCAHEAGILKELPRLAPLPPKGKKLPACPTREDVDAMVGKADGWLRVAIALGAFAGLRSGEVRALEAKDVDLARGALTVKHALSGEANERRSPKSGHEREVPIAEPLRPILAEACKGKLPLARVAVRPDGATPKRQAVLRALVKLQEAHELPRWSFHSLRHFFCSTLLDLGANLEAVRELAGHSKIEITQRYVHARDEQRRAAIGRL